MWPVVIASSAVVLFCCYLRLSWTAAASPDGASAALRAWAMLHGNLLLRGWTLTDVSFYTTELPEYMAIELVRGLNEGTVHTAAALTYTATMLLAAFTARGRARGREGIARMLIAAGIMLAPQPGNGVRLLLSQPDHLGTCVPMLGCFLILDRWPRRRFTPVLLTVLLGLVIVADRVAILDAALPLAVVGSIRAYRAIIRDRRPIAAYWPELSLTAAGLTACAVARAATTALAHAGGYTSLPLVNQVTSSAAMPAHIWDTLEGILNLYGADFFQMHLNLQLMFTGIHLIGAVLAGWALARGLRRFASTDDLLVQVLVIAVVVNLASYTFSIIPLTWYDAREIAPVLPLGAVLAGRVLARPLARAGMYPALACALGGYALALVSAMSQPAQLSPEHALADWLQARHLTTGLGTYTEDNLTTVTSGGRVRLLTVTWTAHGAVPRLYESDKSWYDPRTGYANFIVTSTNPALAANIPRQDILALAGPPAHTYHYATFTIMTWNTNLLAHLGTRPSTAPGSLPQPLNPSYQN
jgi:hypothetical protein